MMKRIINHKGQSVIGEYVLTFFLVIAFMASITLYLKRALQTYIRGARDEMGTIITDRALNTGAYRGDVITEYEPYYIKTSATVDRNLRQREDLFPTPGRTSGLYRKTFDEETTTQTTSETLPPQLAD